MQIKFIWPNCRLHNGKKGQTEIHSVWLEISQLDTEMYILPKLDNKQKLRYEEVLKEHQKSFGFLISGDLKSIWAMPRHYPYSDHWEENPFVRIHEGGATIRLLEEIPTMVDFIYWMDEKTKNQNIENDTRPFEKSYWVLPDQFLAGYYPGSMTEEKTKNKLNSLLDCGIRCFINLMEPDEYSSENEQIKDYTQTLVDIAIKRDIELKIYNFHVRDLSIPSIEQMRKIIKIIDKNLYGDIKRPVYVHCRGGIGRTGTVVGCWLKEHKYGSKGQSVLDVLDNIRAKQIPSKYLYASPETDEQKDFVLNWSE